MTLTEIIIANAISVLALIGVLVWALKRKKSHVTMTSDKNINIVYKNGSKKIYAIIGYFLPIPLIAVDTIVYWFRYVNEVQFFAYFILLLFVIAFSAHYLINYYFDFVTYTDKKISDYSVGKKEPITVNLSTIKNVSIKKTRIMILNKEDKVVASFHVDSINAGALINKLYYDFNVDVLDGILSFYKIDKKIVVEDEDKKSKKEKNNQSSNPSKQENEDKKSSGNQRFTDEQIEAYTQIGKDFRDNEKRNKTIDIVKIVLFQIMLAAIVVGFLLISGNYLMIILFGVNIFVGLSKAKEYKIKYSFFDNSDFDLGLKFAYLCPKVKGHNRTKMRSAKTSSMVLSLIAIIITAFNGYMTFTSKPISYNDDDVKTLTDATLVELKSENHIDLKLKDLEDQYSDYRFTVPDSFYDYIDKEALTKEEVGQKVTVKFTSKNNQATILYLSIGEDIYISQDTLDAHYNHYITNQRIVFYSLVGATVAIIFGSLGYQIFLETRIKKETINLNA